MIKDPSISSTARTSQGEKTIVHREIFIKGGEVSLFFSIFLAILSGCADRSSTEAAGYEVFFNALMQPVNPSSPEDSTICVTASAMADEVPKRLSVKLDGRSPDSLERFAFSYGRIEVRAYFRSALGKVSGDLELETERGRVEGSEKIPDRVAILAPVIDSVFGEGIFRLEWVGDADWYLASSSCSLADGSSSRSTTLLADSVVIGKSISFPAGIFKNCESVRFTVGGFNGPEESSGRGNLTGEGSGFFYATNGRSSLVVDASIP